MEQLDDIVRQALEQFAGIDDPAMLEQAKARFLGKSGALTGYHWGITRKHAMLGWEAGAVAG